MKKLLYPIVLAVLLAGSLTRCTKGNVQEPILTSLTQEEKALITSAGFNGNWAEKTFNGKFLIENDILLSKDQLVEMSGVNPTNYINVANEEHYTTYNLVSVSGSSRTITVRLGSGFPAYFSTGLDQVISRYNSYNLKIKFQRVTSGGEIVINGANLGTSGGGCILGQASGFPTSNGNPSSGFTLSTSSCATSYINTADKADEVMAHEIGHCIGFRHTDYKKRSSCGHGPGESAGSIGAVWVPGTPTNVSGSYNSWMMACVNGSPAFSADDVTALNYIY
ncbi:MAG: M57 family metalloprotease [Saprospiraceae bacterium]